MQKRLMQNKEYDKFFFVSKEACHKPLKVAAAKKSFQGLFIIDTTCFDEYFLLLGINNKTFSSTRKYFCFF